MGNFTTILIVRSAQKLLEDNEEAGAGGGGGGGRGGMVARSVLLYEIAGAATGLALVTQAFAS